MKEISMNIPLLFRKSFLKLNLNAKIYFSRYLNLRYEINSTFLNIRFYKSF